MTFWRKDDPIIRVASNGQPVVEKGGMWEYQREWWNFENFVKLLVGGYGSGKSIQLCKWTIAAALQNAPVPSAIVSPSFPMARRTIVPTLKKLLEGKQTLRPDMKFKHNQAAHEFYIDIECHPRATIMYLSGDNPEALKGANLGTAAIDEPFIQDYDVFTQMLARVRDPDAKILQLGLGGTPEQLNWGYELVEGDLADNYDVGFVVADTRQNKAVSKDYALRLLKGFDEKAAEAYVAGRFVNLSSGRVFYAFDKSQHVKQIAPQSAVHFAGMDFNVDPMSFVVGWHAGGRCHIYAEYEIPNSDTQYACAEIKAKHPEVRMVFPDPTGKARKTSAPGGMSDFKWIAGAGFLVMSPNAPWPYRDSCNSVNNMLSKGKLTFDPSCKRLISYMQQHTHELKRKQKSMTHLLDAMRYPITYLFPAYRKATMTTKIVGA